VGDVQRRKRRGGYAEGERKIHMKRENKRAKQGKERGVGRGRGLERNDFL